MAPPDRLSELPDCLLQTILSPLGARQLVQTTALSRRWRHVWRGVLRLDIDQREFQAADAPADRHGRRDKSLELEEWARFDDFADNLLLSHHHGGSDDNDEFSPPLDALRLHVVGKRDASRRRLPLYARWLDWIHGCLDRYRPAALEIHSDFDMTVDLRLMGLRSDLSRLNTLRLRGILHAGGFGDDSVCPRLEHVEFTSCAIGFEGVVTARTLKKLVIDRCWRRTDTKEEGAPRPRAQAPALTSLRLVMSYQSDIWVFQTPSLVDASIRSTRSLFVNRDDEYELLCNLYNVTRLELSGFLALDKIRPKNAAHQDLPKYHNLTTLLLDDCDLTGEVYNMLDLFLYNASNLEKLTLQNCKVL
ncbi:hypothetical protein ACQ4PT_006298 [Festuca glaucescens]